MKVIIPLVKNVLVSTLAILVLSGCVAYGGNGGPHTHRHPAEHVKIPPGHMPPRGECRIWFPERPPGQQPPPGNCRDLERRVPPDAILVHG